MATASASAISRATHGLGKVAWTRGHGCLPLAEYLSSHPVIAVKGDLQACCVSNRVDLLVARRITSFDLVPVVAPNSVELDRVTAITAAVGDGPHSPLAVAVTARLAATLGVRGEVATVYRTAAGLPVATRRLERLGGPYPHLERRAANEPTPARLVDSLTPSTLLVVGSPGGSWFQRQIFGPGHRLQVAAPAGSIVVRDTARRCYHAAVDASGIAVGPHLTVAEGLRVLVHPAVPVAEEGRLVGILRMTALRGARPDTIVADVMEPPVAVDCTDRIEAAADLIRFLDDSPVPVVDRAGHIVGVLPPTHLTGAAPWHRPDGPWLVAGAN